MGQGCVCVCMCAYGSVGKGTLPFFFVPEFFLYLFLLVLIAHSQASLNEFVLPARRIYDLDSSVTIINSWLAQ